MNLTEEEFIRISAYMHEKYGLALDSKKAFIEGRLINYLLKEGYRNFSEYMDVVEHDYTGHEKETLVNMLTTNHTFFMREFEVFLFFKEAILPELKTQAAITHDIRIWSAASSTGEEPYTIAMLMRDYFSFEYAQWDLSILATDVSTQVLEKAREGIYSKEAISGLPDYWKHNYIKPIDENKCRIVEDIRNNVIFRQLNLMGNFSFREQLHVVFLRNVLIYFDRKTKLEVLQKVYDILKPGGYLVIGSTESFERSFTDFEYVRPSVFRKKERQAV